jgi:hypothetical protein
VAKAVAGTEEERKEREKILKEINKQRQVIADIQKRQAQIAKGVADEAAATNEERIQLELDFRKRLEDIQAKSEVARLILVRDRELAEIESQQRLLNKNSQAFKDAEELKASIVQETQKKIDKIQFATGDKFVQALQLISKNREDALNQQAQLAGEEAQLEVDKTLSLEKQLQFRLAAAQNNSKALLADLQDRLDRTLDLQDLEKEREELLAKTSKAVRAGATEEQKVQFAERLKLIEESISKRQELEFKYNQAKIDGEREIFQTLTDLDTFYREEQLIKLEASLNNDILLFEERREALKERQKLLLQDERLSEAERVAIKKNTQRAIQEINEAELQSYVTLANEVGGLLTNLAGLAAEGSSQQKTLAIAGATISTLASSVSAYAGMVKAIPGPIGIVAGVAAAASALLNGFATVKRIQAVKVPGASGGGGGNTSATAPAAPSFNLVGADTTIGLTDVLANNQIQGQAGGPIRAYVVSTEISSQQALDRDIESTSTVID